MTGPARCWLFLVLLPALATACQEPRRTVVIGPPGADAAVAGDAGDAGPDATSGPDAGPEDAGTEVDATTPRPDAGPTPEAPVAPSPELAPVPVEAWLVGSLPDPGNDPVASALIAGTFELPEPGPGEAGMVWHVVPPEGRGNLGRYQPVLVYAAARIDAEAGDGLVARVDHALAVWANGVRQPADPYGSRRHRVPLPLQAGSNLVVVQAVGGRGDLQVELWRTSDELVFNTADVTFPDLVAGEALRQPLGLPVLNMTAGPALDAVAYVVESEHLWATAVPHPALAAGAATQVRFDLAPRYALPDAELVVPVHVRVESPSLEWAWEQTVELTSISAGGARRRTFTSPVDGSVQYYGLLPPREPDPEREDALLLSLHGAGVQGIGQARSYEQRDWIWVVAPTNRRPFGFDWEEWGHLNGLAALEHALATLPIDPTRVYVSGHSMGGHGTWHFGVMHPGRFAVVAPSAGWGSFYSYTNADRPAGPFARARAHSDTHHYVPNVARRGVYVIHGDADDNVPVREGRSMSDAAREVSDDVVYHEEPGAGHWWDDPETPGADCVNWPPLFEFLRERTVDPHELEFTFTSPSAAYSPDHSYVHLRSAETPYEDLTVTSVRAGDTTVELTTDNVRSLVLDGAALRGKGIEEVVVDGEAHAVPDGPLPVGPQDGKRPGVHGPYNEVFYRPWCFVYPDEDEAGYAAYAAYLTSHWAIIGNGQACALPFSALSSDLRARRNLVYLGVSPMDAAVPSGLPITWGSAAIRLGSRRIEAAALLFVFPEGDRLSAVVTATAGMEHLLYRVVPFSSRSGLPDYLVWSEEGGEAAGFFDSEWGWDPTL